MFPVEGELFTIEWANDHNLILSSSTCIVCWNVKSFSPKWAMEQPFKCHINELGCFAWEGNQGKLWNF